MVGPTSRATLQNDNAMFVFSLLTSLISVAQHKVVFQFHTQIFFRNLTTDMLCSVFYSLYASIANEKMLPIVRPIFLWLKQVLPEQRKK